jgi:hypothetical protein
MPDLLNLIGTHHSPTAMLILGAIGMFIAVALLRLLRRVRRKLWIATVLVAATGTGASSSWATLDGLSAIIG